MTTLKLENPVYRIKSGRPLIELIIDGRKAEIHLEQKVPAYGVVLVNPLPDWIDISAQIRGTLIESASNDERLLELWRKMRQDDLDEKIKDGDPLDIPKI